MLFPVDPQSMLRIIQSEFLNAPLNPIGLGFPLATPLKLNLKDPSGGLVQFFALLIEVGIILVSALLIGNSTIPNSYKINLSFAYAMKSSCVHWCRVIVSFRCASIMVQISLFGVLFSKISLL